MTDNIKYGSISRLFYKNRPPSLLFADKPFDYHQYNKNHPEIREIVKLESYDKVNLNSNKIILFWHCGGDGGNFLMNCLFLSDDILLDKLDLKSKIVLWNDSIQAQKNIIWKDFSYTYDYNLDDIRNDKTLLFVKVHLLSDILQCIKIFKNSKVIIFKNPLLFQRIRRCVWDGAKLINGGKGSFVGHFNNELPINFREFMNLEEDQKNKIIKEHNNLIKKYYENHEYSSEKRNAHQIINLIDFKNYPRYPNPFYSWDVNWYLSEKNTLDNIEILYNMLSLSGFDRKLISKFYNMWIDKMDEIKKIR